ncbi:GNAT family N-acetyltransferase [Paenibacillus spongiae]|uniref:GNAT family N-acetyltransferase n=1 Tax=Paenibacillus spongiae TaxID=2909671 RepID=A0ABY5S692_9BACL|nr:GNAT family protein [Paenibacillus spongiae]UVI29003.1 GNAT family N-acetyltransferase [Paenibacillus spongiae]
MKIYAKRIYIRRLQMDDADQLLELLIRNKSFLQPLEPLRQESYYTLEWQKESLEKVQYDWEHDVGYGFGIYLNNGRLIGRVNISNISRGAWESCTIGYLLDEPLNGQGFMTEAVASAVHYCFNDAGLHRVQSAVMPHNAASIRVLEKVGFRYEGFAEYYLKINGNWEHHNIYSMTREYWKPQSRILN